MAKKKPAEVKEEPKASPPPSPKDAPPEEKKGKKGKKGKGKGKGKKGKAKKANPNKKMTLLFYVNGQADTTPFMESKVKTRTLNHIMETNLHGEWEYRKRFICNLDGTLLQDPQTEINKTMAFVMVPRSESFKPAYYKRKFVQYMTELKKNRKTTCW